MRLPYERLDRAAFFHGAVRLPDGVEVGLEVEDALGTDAALEDVIRRSECI